jgi:polyhydroxyalkanoate synthase
VISGPQHPRRRYRVNTRLPGEKYIDPDTWLQQQDVVAGSWWPLWNDWLDDHTSSNVAPPKMGAPRKGYKILRDAPGEYVHG